MSTDRSRNPLLNTLGFFLHGVPVVFVRTAIAFSQAPGQGDYLRFYQDCMQDRCRNADFAGPQLLHGCESFLAPIHEVKHFHDALLCRPLFELFLLRNMASWSVLQLAREFRGLSMDRLPLDLRVDHPDILTSKGTIALQETRKVMATFDRRWHQVFEHVPYRDSSLTLVDLLETSAMLLELAHVVSVHGEAAGEEYYEHVVRPLPAEYSFLLRSFVERRGNLIVAMNQLYPLLAYSLYRSDAPVSAFVTLEHAGRDIPNRMQDLLQTELGKPPVEEEAALKHRIESMRLSAADGSDIDLGHLFDDEVVGPMLTSHRSIYACREQLQQTYLGRFGLALDTYLERYNELPTPPLLFFSVEEADGMIETVPERDVRRLAPELFILRAHPDDMGNVLIVAGLRNVPGCTSAISLSLADLHLQSLFHYRMLFERRETLYSPTIDEGYLRVFKKFFLGELQET